MFATEDAWRRAWAQWEKAEGERLSVLCADVVLGLQIENAAGLRARTTLLKLVQAQMLTKPSAFTGELFGPFNRPVGLMGATVHRVAGQTDGPRLVAPTAGSVLRPQVDKIAEKLTMKTYETSAPLELFAYSTHDEVDAYSDGLRQVDNCVKRYLPNSRFRRVWVFDGGIGRQAYVYPPP